jgi:hypothetical protein
MYSDTLECDLQNLLIKAMEKAIRNACLAFGNGSPLKPIVIFTVREPEAGANGTFTLTNLHHESQSEVRFP